MDVGRWDVKHDDSAFACIKIIYAFSFVMLMVGVIATENISKGSFSCKSIILMNPTP
jgi:hypothetical protein